MDLSDPPVLSSVSHNESLITLNTTEYDLSLKGLQKENEMLKKKITYLQKIVSLKDNTIADLNKKLLELSKDDEHIPVIDDSNNLSIIDNNKHTDSNLKSAKVIGHQQSESLASTQTSDDSNSKTLWEIPQRNNNRSLSKTPASMNPLNESKAINNDNTKDNTDSKHKHNYSITSITSSKYSDNEKVSSNKTPIIDVVDYSSNNNNTTNDDTAEISNHQSTLELDLKQGNITLGSSPRKLSPNRRSFSLNELALKQSESNNSTNVEKNTNDSDDDFNFGVLATPDEPVYRKLNKDYSANSSPIVDYFAQRQSTLLASDSTNLVPVNFSNSTKSIFENPLNSVAFTIDSNNELSTSHSTTNSIQDSMHFNLTPTLEEISNGSFTNQKLLIPSTLLQNNKQDASLRSQNSTPPPPNASQPSVSSTLPPTPPIHPPPVPHHPTLQSAAQIATPPPSSSSTSSNNHKRIESTDDSEKFLLNSLNHAIIRIESLIDPSSLATPLDINTNSPLVKAMKNNYKISFLVYTDENPNSLTPIYRVKKSYLELIMMDKSIRPLMPSLPSLPNFNQVACLNQKHWANSKKVIQNYINKLLSLLKNQKPFNPNNSIWKNFSNYFEFKMDYSMPDDPEFSVLNLQNKITYLLYIRKNFTMKTYDFIKLNVSNDSNILVMNFLLSKSQEILQRDEVNISFKNQEIVVKKKKKFTATKSWIFYAESDYDASELCTKISNWIGTSISEFNDDDLDPSEDPQTETEGISKQSLDHTTASTPPLNAPWKLFKKSNKNQQLQNQTQSQTQYRSSQSSMNGIPQILTSPRQSTSATLYSNSTPGSPSKHSPSSVSTPNDVLNFKAMPYDGGLLTIDNNSHPSLTLKSPIKTQNKSPYLTNEMTYQPIDDTPSYFKSTLQHSYDLCPNYKLFDVSVPSIVYQCITFLHHQSGEGFEGIFRLNGMMSEVNKIQEIFNEKYDCDLSKLPTLPDVHSIATLLKRYLRNLKDRLISDEITNELNIIINNNGLNKKTEIESKTNLQGIQEFKATFNKIPELNRNVMFVLFKYLCDVLKMGKHNKMTANAMSVLMGPNLSQCDGGGHICITLLESFDQIFTPN